MCQTIRRHLLHQITVPRGTHGQQ